MTRKLEILAGLGASEPGSQYVRLTPSGPSVPWKAAFVFVAPKLVEGGQGYVSFIQQPLLEGYPLAEALAPGLLEEFEEELGRAVLWLYSAKARKYLIDCAVDGTYHTGGEAQTWGGGPILTVTGPDNGSQVFDYRQAWSPNGYHLVFAFEADGAGWYPFSIASGASEPGTGVKWDLFACEVTNL